MPLIVLNNDELLTCNQGVRSLFLLFFFLSFVLAVKLSMTSTANFKACNNFIICSLIHSCFRWLVGWFVYLFVCLFVCLFVYFILLLVYCTVLYCIYNNRTGRSKWSKTRK